MSDDKLVRVRVLPQRSLSLSDGADGKAQHVAGDVLELPADDAYNLVADGFVEKVK